MNVSGTKLYIDPYVSLQALRGGDRGSERDIRGDRGESSHLMILARESFTHMQLLFGKWLSFWSANEGSGTGPMRKAGGAGCGALAWKRVLR